MSITKPVFVNFSIQGPQWAEFVDFNNSVQWAEFVDFNNSVQWAFPQPPKRRKKSNLARIKRRLIKKLFTHR